MKSQSKLQVIREDQSGATYRIGNTHIEIIAPQISEDERQRRLREIQRVGSLLLSQTINQSIV